MQSEHAPVLRFNVAAFVLCAVSMVVFGLTLHERAARHADDQVDQARRQLLREVVLRDERTIALRDKLDAVVIPDTGCTLGSHSSRAEIERMRDKLEVLRDERAAQLERLEILRCRQQTGCTIYSPVY